MQLSSFSIDLKRVFSSVRPFRNNKESPGSPLEASGRIDFIDGLRGVAIIAVILFHAYARWPGVYLYGSTFVGSPIFNTGIAGVDLFFIISGFVILLTLRKCRGFSDFIVRRWYRLFPAMLVCSLLVWLTAGLFPERPSGEVHMWDLMPGLTLIGDGWLVHQIWDHLGSLLGIKIKSVEGAFWSLYVEVKFYIVFGLAYFMFSERIGIAALLLLFSLGKLASPTALHLHFGPWDISGPIFAPMQQALAAIGVQYVANFLYSEAYGFFAAGALFFLYYATRKWKFYWSAVVVGVISCRTGADFALTILFAFAIACAPVQLALSNRILVFVGFISYPLYLIHENMMVAMIVKIGRIFPNMFAILIPILPILFVVGGAWIIARNLEPATRKLLDERTPKNPAFGTQTG